MPAFKDKVLVQFAYGRQKGVWVESLAPVYAKTVSRSLRFRYESLENPGFVYFKHGLAGISGGNNLDIAGEGQESPHRRRPNRVAKGVGPKERERVRLAPVGDSPNVFAGQKGRLHAWIIQGFSPKSRLREIF
jgi:hypothetical protein